MKQNKTNRRRRNRTEMVMDRQKTFWYTISHRGS